MLSLWSRKRLPDRALQRDYCEPRGLVATAPTILFELNDGLYPILQYQRCFERKRPYLLKEWCIRVIAEPLKSEQQDGNRFRFWAACPELEGRYLRVVTLGDKVTIHNAFPDRGFKP